MSGRRLVRNSLFMTGSVVGGGLLLFFILVLCARYIGVEQFGKFTLVITIAAIFQLFADGGLVNITIRDAARDTEKSGEILGATRALAWLMTVVLGALLVLASEILVQDRSFKITLYAMGAAALAALHASVYAAILRAHEDMGIVAVSGIAHKVVLLGMVVAAIKLDAKIEGVAVAHLAANLLQWFFHAALVRSRYARSRLRLDRAHVAYLMREALPLGAGVVLRRFNVHLHTFLLTGLAGAMAVGLYNSAYRFLQMIEVGALALASVLFPALAKLQKSSQEQFNKLYADSLRMMVVASAPVGGLLAALGDRYVIVIYGDSYASAGIVLKILGASLIFLVPGALAHSVFSALGRQASFMRVSLAGIVANVLIGGAMIRFYQSTGAALATLSTELVTFIVAAWYFRAEKVVVDYTGIYLRAAVPAAILAVPASFLGHSYGLPGLIAATAIYGIAYAVAAFLCGAITPKELALIAGRRRKPQADAVANLEPQSGN